MRTKDESSQTNKTAPEPRALPTYARGFGLLLSGAISFPKERRNEVIEIEDKRRFRVFNNAVRDPKGKPPVAGVFRVWFHSRTSPGFTMFYTNFMMPFFLGMPGFRSKLWLINDETGDFGGIYEWDTVEDAGRYASSFAMRLSKMRSVPGSFSAEFFSVSDPRAETGRTARAEGKPV